MQENNRTLQELNSAYDQINKLNATLMSKQEQLNKQKYYKQFNHSYEYNNNKEQNSMIGSQNTSQLSDQRQR